MLKPWLWLPPKLAHDLSPIAVELYSSLNKGPTAVWNSFSWNNLHFKNRLGLAGGVDKNADHTIAWQNLGCGFIEIGTVTPLAQKPNTGVIFDRSIKDQALWNKMGFPSAGADEVYYNLRSAKENLHIPLFVNIGKNRSTSNENASEDYQFLLERFSSVADAFVINISSPNTKGLRDLAKPELLSKFLKPIVQKKIELNCQKPILIKLSPDLSSDDLKTTLDTSIASEIDGFILTNTTLSRETEKKFSDEGGISGKPLSDLAKLSLKTAISHLGTEKTKKLVISVGGVMTAEDVFERIDIGADLVEVYSALIFSGLNFFRKVEKAAHEPK